MKDFDPNKVAVPNGKLWALPCTPEEAALVIIPRPIDITTSFRDGTSNGPAAILAASTQIDLYDEDHPDMWKKGIALDPRGTEDLVAANCALRVRARSVIKHLEQGGAPSDVSDDVAYVNNSMRLAAAALKVESGYHLDRGKLVAVLGGDHSTPLGLMHALADRHERFGVLHIDAHLDLRDTYEGFKQSHASIMRNAAEIPQIARFVHVGVRDFCEEEALFVEENGHRHAAASDRWLAQERASGRPWYDVAQQLVMQLPQKVYVSFDIDALDASLCPNTGTPVPGGLQYEEAFLLLRELVETGRRIVGFDLVEVAPASSSPHTWAADWNANVGMRALYRLSALALASQENL